MSKPSLIRAAGWLWRSLLAVIAIGLAGCQPEAIPSKPGKNPVPPGAPSVPSKSKTTSAERAKIATSLTSAGKPTGEPTAKKVAGDSAAPKASDTAGGEEPKAVPGSTEKLAEVNRPPVRQVSRRPTAPGEPLEISFEDLVIGMQADVVFRPWMMTDRAKEVEGQTVRLVGYMHAGVNKDKHIKELVLLRNLECKFGPGGQADHLVMVKFKPGVEATFTKNAVEIQGILKVNPYLGADGNTWSIYDLEGSAFKESRRN